jgi:hypothetical protein
MATIRKRMQFQDIFQEVWVYTGTLDLGNAATGSGTFASSDVTVQGVALGDMVLGVSLGVDTVDAAVVGAVTAANTVTVTLLNNTAGAVNLASTTARIIIGKLNTQNSFV